MIIILKNCLVPDCAGADHKWEFERPTLREIQRIQQITGLDVDAWGDGLNGALGAGMSGAAIDATLALVDILHRRDGVKVAFDDIDVDLGSMDFEFDDAEVQEAEAGQEEGEGKDPAPISPSHPREDEAPASGSGPVSEEVSPPRSWPTPQTSGGGSDSP